MFVAIATATIKVCHYQTAMHMYIHIYITYLTSIPSSSRCTFSTKSGYLFIFTFIRKLLAFNSRVELFKCDNDKSTSFIRLGRGKGRCKVTTYFVTFFHHKILYIAYSSSSKDTCINFSAVGQLVRGIEKFESHKFIANWLKLVLNMNFIATFEVANTAI